MAYAFSAINSLLDESEQQKANIFGQDAGGASGTPSSGQIGEQAQVKTDDSSSLTSGGGAGGGTSEGTAPVVTDAKASDRKAVQANVGKTQTPKALEGVQSGLAEANQKLQDEANQYATTQKANQNYAVGNEDIEKSISSQDPNSAERKKTADLINRQTIKDVAAWKPATDYEIEDASLLNNDAGLSQLASRGMGPQYTGGEAAFDVRALRKTPGFSNLIKQLQGQQQDLRNSAQQDRAKDIATYGQEQLTTAQKQARDYLGSQQSALDAQNAQEAAAWNANLNKLKSQGLGEAERQAAIDAARKESLARLDPRFARVANQLNIDTNPYTSFAGEQGGDTFYDAGEAQRFNSIMGLLGQGGPSKAAGAVPKELYSLDRTGLQNAAMEKITAARAAEDNAQRDKINQIMKGLESNSQRLRDERKTQGYNQAYGSQADILKELGLDRAVDMNLVNPDQYFNTGGDFSGLDYADQGTANELNSIYADLGDQTRVGAGRNFTNPAALDSDGYKNAVRAALQKIMADDAASGVNSTVGSPGGNDYGGYFDPARDAFGDVMQTPFKAINAVTSTRRRF